MFILRGQSLPFHGAESHATTDNSAICNRTEDSELLDISCQVTVFDHNENRTFYSHPVKLDRRMEHIWAMTAMRFIYMFAIDYLTSRTVADHWRTYTPLDIACQIYFRLLARPSSNSPRCYRSIDVALTARMASNVKQSEFAEFSDHRTVIYKVFGHLTIIANIEIQENIWLRDCTFLHVSEYELSKIYRKWSLLISIEAMGNIS